MLPSVTRRSRSFWYSRMPLAKMRSIGPDSRAFWAAAANRSFRLVPDQNSRSNSSLRARVRLSEKNLRKIAAQLATDTTMRSNTTSCTGMLAWSRREMIDSS